MMNVTFVGVPQGAPKHLKTKIAELKEYIDDIQLATSEEIKTIIWGK